MFGEVVLVDIVGQSIELPTDKHCFQKRSNQGTIILRKLVVNCDGWPVHHATTRLIWALSCLNVIPVFHRPTIFEAENFKTNIPTREIVFGMCENEITILEGPHDVYSGRGF